MKKSNDEKDKKLEIPCQYFCDLENYHDAIHSEFVAQLLVNKSMCNYLFILYS